MAFLSQNFVVNTASVRRVVEAAERSGSRAGGTGLLFLSGTLTTKAKEIAGELAERSPTVSWLVVCASGVITERGELDGMDAAAGMLITSPCTIVLEKVPDSTFGLSLLNTFRTKPGSSAQVFIQSNRLRDDWLDTINQPESMLAQRIFGGGVSPESPLLAVRGGHVESGAAAALVLESTVIAQICASSAGRLLSPLGEVTKIEGNSVLEIDGAPALQRLNESASMIQDGSLILAALGAQESPLAEDGRKIALLALEGIDPDRGAIVLGPDISLGARLSFAVRDAHFARKDFAAHLHSLARSSAGRAPCFGLYACCAGRGKRLYEQDDVEVRLIRKAFPAMPLLGLHSTFELAVLDGKLLPQVFSGVLAIFSQPS